MDCFGPPVGRDHHCPTNGRTTEDRSCKKDIHTTKWPLHAQWARPAGQGPKVVVDRDVGLCAGGAHLNRYER